MHEPKDVDIRMNLGLIFVCNIYILDPGFTVLLPAAIEFMYNMIITKPWAVVPGNCEMESSTDTFLSVCPLRTAHTESTPSASDTK